MRNIFIIGIIVLSLGYMFVILKDKYNNIKETNTKIEKQKSLK